MKRIEHKINHIYQPTNKSCGQTIVAMLLEFYGKKTSLDEVIKQIPIFRNEKGEDQGTSPQNQAIFCISQGFKVDLYVFDWQIIDLSWAVLSREALLQKFEAIKGKRKIPSLGEEWSEIYIQSYIDFLKAGGELHIRPYIESSLLYGLLEDGPVAVSVSFNVLYNQGRSKNAGLRKSVANDIDGNLALHSVLLYGSNEQGNFLIADPWEEPGLHTIEPDRLICSMMAAGVEYDNLIYQIKP